MPESKKLFEISPEEFSKLLNGKAGKDLSGKSHDCLKLNPDGNHIILIDRFLVEGIIKVNVNHTYTIHFSKECIIDTLMFVDSSSISALIIIDQADISELIIEDNSQVKFLNINGKSSLGSLDLAGNSIIDQLTVSDSAQILWLTIVENSLVKNISILSKPGIGDFDIYDNSKIEQLHLASGSFIEDLSIFGDAQVLDLTIKESAFIKSISLADSCIINSFSITEKAQIDEIHFEGGLIKNELYMTEWKSKSLKIQDSGTSFPQKILVNSVTINRLSFIDFHVNSILHISKLSSNKSKDSLSLIEFTNCTFNKLELIDNSLESFDYLVFHNSDIISSFLAGTNFPSKVVSNIEIKDQESFENYSQQKLFYEQLKVALTRIGNRTDALKFQAKELNAHYKILNWNKNFWDKLTLWFNKNTTNFGTSWTRGFLALLVTTIPLFVLLLWSTKGVVAVWPWQMNSEDFGLYATQYFDFINPTSYIWKRWDFIYELEGGEVRWGVKLLLLFSKVLIVTIIYQIIQAFRKFGRK